MKYCLICGEELKPGSVCDCGWDPSRDYENYLSLVPLRAEIRSSGSRRKAFVKKQIEAQKQADEARLAQLKQKYDAKIEELGRMQKADGEKIQMLEGLQRAKEAKIQALEDRQKTDEAKIQALEDRQKTDEAKIQALEDRQKADEAKIQALEDRQKTDEATIQALEERQNTDRELLESQLKTANNAIQSFEDWKQTCEARINALSMQSKKHRHSSVPEPEKEVLVKNGKEITFGAYWQGINKSDGKTAIQWIVLAKEGHSALLLSKYGLDARSYNTEFKSVTWAEATLEKWLNNEFFREAFTADEQARIISKTVSADANPKYKINPGISTNDHVFLLSIQEVEKYFASDEQRICRPTAYAKAQGAYVSGSAKSCEWWLRSTGCRGGYAAGVHRDGKVSYSGDFVYTDDVIVRPAIWINL